MIAVYLQRSIRIFLTTWAVGVAAFAQAASVPAHETVGTPSDVCAGAITLPVIAPTQSPAAQKVGDLQDAAKTPAGKDLKHEEGQSGNSRANGVTSPDPKNGDEPQKTPSQSEPAQEVLSNGPNGAVSAAPSAKPATPFPPTYESNIITFTPGFRIQLRYIHDTASGKDELFIARLRLKAKGQLFHTVKYYTEYRIDTLARSGRDPVNGFENAWLDYSIVPNFAIRGGLYDIPFSRNALTSDSKLLFIDRSLIKDQLTVFGFADNTVGLLGHGRPFKGRLEYAGGIFNNEKFRKFRAPGSNRSDHLMPAGRIVYNFLNPSAPGGYGDYQSSYLGKGKRLSVGANSAYMSKAHDSLSEFNLLGWGTDVFFSHGPFSAEAEYDHLSKKLSGKPDVQMDGWYAQAGYLFWRRIEFAARHQQLDPIGSIPNNHLKWTSVGSNIYFRNHNIKLQVDYTFRRGPGQLVKTDVLQVQMQVDY